MREPDALPRHAIEVRSGVALGAEDPDVNMTPMIDVVFQLILFFMLTSALVILGGLVTSTGSGLSVPDWPLSYGEIMPPMVGNVRFEHGHRMIAELGVELRVVQTVDG